MQWLAKAQVQRLTADGSPAGNPLDVLFNPTEYTLAKSAQYAEIPVPGLDSPMLQFVRGQTETMTVDLFFDTTDAGGTGDQAKPVTAKTDAFYQLIKIEAHSHAPPVILFSWGGDAFPGHRTYETLAGQNRYGFKGADCSQRTCARLFQASAKSGCRRVAASKACAASSNCPCAYSELPQPSQAARCSGQAWAAAW